MAGGLKSIIRAAPLRGMNTEMPLLQMPPEFCQVLLNVYCTEQNLVLRNGCTAYGDAAPGTEQYHLLFKHVKTDGTEVLISTGNNKFYTVSGTGAPSEITGTTTPTFGKWTSVFMNGTTVFFNSINTPQKYTGSGNVSDATYTGSGLTATNLRAATVYRDRIYIIEQYDLKVWYGASNAVTGALTLFDLSYVFKKGGYPQIVATWTIDDGGGLDDRLVIGTSEGEVVVYAGSYPGGQDWYKIGHFFFPAILQRQSYFNLAGDLYILTREAIISLKSALLQGSRNYETLTQNIKTIYKSCVTDFLIKPAWRVKAVIDDRLNSLLISLPVGSASHELIAGGYILVMNLSTGAWSYFLIHLSDIEVLKDYSIIATSKNKYAKFNYGTYDYASDGDLDTPVLGSIYYAPISLGGNKKFRYISHYLNLDYNSTLNYQYYDATFPNLEQDIKYMRLRSVSTNSGGLTMQKFGVSHYGSIVQPALLSIQKLTADTGGHFYASGYELQYEDMGGL